jgi:ABC-type uncharacterized transport system substrate-binding protein
VRRREFITLLGGAAATWPLAARAQQSEKMRRIGVLMPFTADDPEVKARRMMFEQSLQQLGWNVGRNAQIDYRTVGGAADPIRRYAAELVALEPDVIVPIGSVTIGPLQQVTRTIPIVMVNVADPVAQALCKAWRGRAATPPGSSISNTP